MPDSTFTIIYIIGLIIGCVIRGVCVFRVRNIKRNKQDRITDDRETGLDKLLVFIPAFGMFIIPVIYLLSSRLDFADYRLPIWAGWTGAVVFVAGLWLLWRSHTDLGNSWLPTLQIRENHSLITRGVFLYIRHPMYAAHLLWGIGQALLLQNWIAGPSMLLFLLPLYVLRIPREEQMMLDHFGEEYRLYMNRTGRIIPRL